MVKDAYSKEKDTFKSLHHLPITFFLGFLKMKHTSLYLSKFVQSTFFGLRAYVLCLYINHFKSIFKIILYIYIYI
jgi:hypothetical protein